MQSPANAEEGYRTAAARIPAGKHLESQCKISVKCLRLCRLKTRGLIWRKPASRLDLGLDSFEAAGRPCQTEPAEAACIKCFRQSPSVYGGVLANDLKYQVTQDRSGQSDL
jgi:hypothetical protein